MRLYEQQLEVHIEMQLFFLHASLTTLPILGFDISASLLEGKNVSPPIFVVPVPNHHYTSMLIVL